jgi:hypothetical protein
MTKAWLGMLAALVALLAIGPRSNFDPTLPIIGIVVVGFIMLIHLISPPLATRGGDSAGSSGAYFAPSRSFDPGGLSGSCDGDSSGGGDCGCSC